MAVTVLSAKDPGIRAFIQSHARLRDAKRIGKGTFCHVFETADPTRVLKLTADFAHTAYLTDRMAPQGRFKPVVHADFKAVCETLCGLSVHLLEVERLQKIRRGSPNGRLVSRILRFVNKTGGCAYGRLPTHEDELPWLPADLGEFLQEVNDFPPLFNCQLDLHWANFMERADGTLVLSDPVCDHQTLQRYRSRRHAC